MPRQLILFLTILAPLFAQAESISLPKPPESIVAPGVKVEKLAGGMRFTEGPVWLPKEKMLVFSDIPNSILMQWTEKDGLKVYRKDANPNGNVLDAEGRLVTCQQGAGSIIRTNKDGQTTILTDKFEGKRFNSPNDLAIHKDGSIWFTDPSYGLGNRPAEISGKWVFRLDPKSNELTVISKDFDMPNGIVFSPDFKRVYIADTGKLGTIRAYDLKDKTISEKHVLEMPIRSDGMCVDTEGNIYTTSRGGVHIFKPDGTKLGIIPTPEWPSNACFGGADNSTLYITARTSVYAIKTKTKGAGF